MAFMFTAKDLGFSVFKAKDTVSSRTFQELLPTGKIVFINE